MGKLILIVDDSESIREIIQFTLENAGYDVVAASNGKQALEYFDGRDIKLLLTDLHMPEMDGIELIKNVRNIYNYKHIPILFLTTESQLEKKMKAKEAGATGWIIKPFIPTKLLSTLNKVIRT